MLTRGHLERLLDLGAALAVLDEGFRLDRDHSVAEQRVRTALPGPGSATAILPGVLPSVPAYTAKVNAKFPAATPALRGIVCLHDLETGALLALLDSSTITAWRTGLAAALASDRLARHSAVTISVIGAGAQADLVIAALARLRRLERLSIFDISAAAAARFADKHARTTPRIEIADTLSRCVDAADIIVVATWSTAPIVGLGDVRVGQHVTSLGADEPTKRELDVDLLTHGLLVVDDRDLAASAGVVASAGLSGSEPSVIDATFSAISRGVHPGRTSDDQITIYSPVGLPWQDIALAWLAYERAERAGVGTTVDFLQ